MAESWTGTVLDFWFALEPNSWWTSNAELDAEITERFLPLWKLQKQRVAADFLGDAETALAAIILFDQFPRNMFRDHADSFATDHLAIEIARAAVDRDYDDRFVQPRRGFFYMPFQHSEDLDDQQRSMLLFTGLGDEDQLRFARKHYEVIERFGRFPHRNAMLGRAPRPEEIAAGDVNPTHS